MMWTKIIANLMYGLYWLFHYGIVKLIIVGLVDPQFPLWGILIEASLLVSIIMFHMTPLNYREYCKVITGLQDVIESFKHNISIRN